jgi:hypothetical protein
MHHNIFQVRRLKIQETFKKSESDGHVYEEDLEEQYRGEYPSALPLLPPLVRTTQRPFTQSLLLFLNGNTVSEKFTVAIISCLFQFKQARSFQGPN